ncbi:zinc-binding dehydrogenase [Novosphingobium sp.]|uniref:zinc-binding dehydrogenase n=1 Tax=Novosphingobium sp. TaxID=1874826 RepID=UPI0031D52864
MRSVLYRRHGDPAEVLETVDVEDPARPAPGEVLVRVTQRPVHYGDLLGIAGRYRSGGDLSVPEGGNRVGFEGFGLIEEAGEGVDLAPGTRVAFFPGRAAWSEHALVSADFVTAIPDTISDEIAAQLHVNPLTTALLRRAVIRAGVQPGNDVVVLTAAGSAVAKLVIATLGRMGIDAIGVVRSDSGAAELSALVPGLPVISTQSEGWQERLTAVAANRPIKAVLDPVGGDLASQMVTLLASGGSLISYGDLSGEPIAVPALFFSTRNITIFGVTVGSWASLPKAQRIEDLELALQLAADHPSLFPVAARYDLADARQAAAHVERPGKAGVVLLTSP